MKKKLTNQQVAKNINLRLKLYKKALEDYQLGDHPNTIRGFCFYFFIEHQIDVYQPKEMKITLPELYTQKSEWERLDTFWFAPSDTLSRIVCLKNAIKMIQDEKEKENNLQ